MRKFIIVTLILIVGLSAFSGCTSQVDDGIQKPTQVATPKTTYTWVNKDIVTWGNGVYYFIGDKDKFGVTLSQFIRERKPEIMAIAPDLNTTDRSLPATYAIGYFVIVKEYGGNLSNK